MKKRAEIGGFFDYLLVVVAILLVGVIIVIALKYSKISTTQNEEVVVVSGSIKDASIHISRLIQDCYNKMHKQSEDCTIFRLELDEGERLFVSAVDEEVGDIGVMYWDEGFRDFEEEDFIDRKEYKIRYNFNNKEIEVIKWS